MSSLLSERGLASRWKEEPDFRDVFHYKYMDKTILLSQHINRLSKCLEDKKTGLESSQMVRNATIASRLKKEESAIESLGHREKQREVLGRLKSRLEACGESWEEYWARQVEPPPWWKDEHRPFHDIDEMLSALPDIGGIRICVYNPEDVEKVVDYFNSLYIPDHADRSVGIFDRIDFLEESPQVVRYPHNMTYPLEELEHHINLLEKNGNRDLSPEVKKLRLHDQFPGYRATHLRVQLKADLVYDGFQPKGSNIIEIQVMTVIMDTWARVVHGLTYDPGLSPLDSLQILLDQLSGMVLLSETTLIQVSRVRQDLEIRHTEDQGATPDDWHELGAWLSRACKFLETESSSLPMPISPLAQFGKLDELLKVLSVTGAPTYRRLQRLLEKAHKSHGSKIITYHLPIHLLRALAESGERNPVSMVVYDDNDDGMEVFFRQTRRKVQKTIHIINMARFLGIAADFVKYTQRALRKLDETASKNSQTKKPSIVELLDLLHPEHPRMCGSSSMSRIQDFCRAFCERSCLADVVEDPELLAQLELPRMLVKAGYVARPILDDPSETSSHEQVTSIPRDLCAFLDDVDDTHFIPEIFYVAERIARMEAPEDPSPDQVPSAFADATPLISANLTRWLGSRRLQLEANGKDEDFFRMFFDRVEVPMRSRFNLVEGIMVLEIDKHKEHMWPHPGFFSTTVGTEQSHYRGKLPRWKYIEKEPNDWDIRKLKDERPLHKAQRKAPEEDNFLGLLRRLHPDCAAIELVHRNTKVEHYCTSISSRRFCITSTPESFILEDETRTHKRLEALTRTTISKAFTTAADTPSIGDSSPSLKNAQPTQPALLEPSAKANSESSSSSEVETITEIGSSSDARLPSMLELPLDVPGDVALLLEQTGATETGRSYIRIEANWEILHFWREEVSSCREDCRRVLVLVGSPDSAQSSSCQEYIQSRWGQSGLQLLDTLLDGMVKGLEHKSIDSTSGNKLDFSIEFQSDSIGDEQATLYLSGDSSAVISAVAQILFLAAVFRRSSQRGLASSTISLIPIHGSYKLSLRPLIPIADEPNRGTSCWFDLFPVGIIVPGFPISPRTEGIGLEIPFPIMTALAQVSFKMVFENGPLLVGHSTVLFPSRKLQDGVQWHYMRTEDLNSTIDTLKSCVERVTTMDMGSLWTIRTFVGHYIRANVHLGSSDLLRNEVQASALGRSSSSPELSREFTMTPGVIAPGFANLTTTAKIVLQKSLQVSLRENRGYYDRLSNSRRRGIVLYDSKCLVGWLVPEISVVLHLVFSYLNLPEVQNRMRDHNVALEYISPGCRKADDEASAAFDLIHTLGSETLYCDESKNPKTFHSVVDDFLKDIDAIRNATRLRQSQSGFSMSRSNLRGWEFNDLTTRRMDLVQRELKTARSCWWSICEDSSILVLFGQGFGQVIRSSSPFEEAPGWQEIPSECGLLVASHTSISHLSTEGIPKCQSACPHVHITPDVVWSRAQDNCEETFCGGACFEIQQLEKLSKLLPISLQRASIGLEPIRREAFIFGDHSQYHERLLYLSRSRGPGQV